MGAALGFALTFMILNLVFNASCTPELGADTGLISGALNPGRLGIILLVSLVAAGVGWVAMQFSQK